MLLSLLLLAMPVTVDNIDATDMFRVSQSGKTDRYSSILHQAKITMFSDAQSGLYCSDLFFRDGGERTYVKAKLTNQFYHFVESVGNHLTLRVCWGMGD